MLHLSLIIYILNIWKSLSSSLHCCVCINTQCARFSPFNALVCLCVYYILFTGVDLSNIVKAIPKMSSEESTEDQTHEVLQVCSHVLRD